MIYDMSFLSILLVFENCNFRSLKVLENFLNFVVLVCYEPCTKQACFWSAYHCGTTADGPVFMSFQLLVLYIHLHQGGYVFGRLCLFVCLSVCLSVCVSAR